MVPVFTGSSWRIIVFLPTSGRYPPNSVDFTTKIIVGQSPTATGGPING